MSCVQGRSLFLFWSCTPQKWWAPTLKYWHLFRPPCPDSTLRAGGLEAAALTLWANVRAGAHFGNGSQKELLKTLACWDLPSQTQLYGNTGISWSHQLHTETPFPALHPWILPLPQFSSILAYFAQTFIHSTPTKLQIKFSLLSLPRLLSVFPTCIWCLSLFYCYAFSLINRCRFSIWPLVCKVFSTLWLRRGHFGLYGFAVLPRMQFPWEKEKEKKTKKEERKSSPSYFSFFF